MKKKVPRSSNNNIKKRNNIYTRKTTSLSDIFSGLITFDVSVTYKKKSNTQLCDIMFLLISRIFCVSLPNPFKNFNYYILCYMNMMCTHNNMTSLILVMTIFSVFFKVAKIKNLFIMFYDPSFVR